MQQNIHIRHQDKYYRFISVIFHLNDASIMICLNRDGKTVRINYHATGQINYHLHHSSQIYHEPLPSLSARFELIQYSVPDLTLLDLAEEKDLSDADREASLEIDRAATGQHSFAIAIAPFQTLASNAELFRVAIGNAWAITVEKNQSQLSGGFEIKAPAKGALTKLGLPIDQAILRSLHRLGGRDKGLTIFPPNGASVIKIVPSVPMRVVPDVTIHFADPGYTATLLREESKNYRVHVDVRGPVGRQKIKTLPGINSITLDAEL